MNQSGSGDGYLILAYAVSLALLWGYAVASWAELGKLHRRHRGRTSTGFPGPVRDAEKGDPR
jgi:hypothetical protein